MQYIPDDRNPKLPSPNLEPSHSSSSSSSSSTTTTTTTATKTNSVIEPLPEAQQANQQKPPNRPSAGYRGKLNRSRSKRYHVYYTKKPNFLHCYRALNKEYRDNFAMFKLGSHNNSGAPHHQLTRKEKRARHGCVQLKRGGRTKKVKSFRNQTPFPNKCAI